MDKIKKLFQSNDSKRGSYTLAMTSIVIAIVIIFNMIINLIPENKRQFDISSSNIYEISSKSKKIINKVDHDVTFYVLAEKSSTDKRIKTFINKYSSLSDNEKQIIKKENMYTKYMPFSLKFTNYRNARNLIKNDVSETIIKEILKK